jgi:hypothetical protein
LALEVETPWWQRNVGGGMLEADTQNSDEWLYLDDLFVGYTGRG